MSAHDPLPIASIQPAPALPAEARSGVSIAGAGPKADPPPARPSEPDPADCCGEGCIRCVYDRYDEQLERYQLALTAWQSRHP